MASKLEEVELKLKPACTTVYNEFGYGQVLFKYTLNTDSVNTVFGLKKTVTVPGILRAESLGGGI